jgi:hypothetical protein
MRFLALATPLLVLLVLPALDHLEEWSGCGRSHRRPAGRRAPRDPQGPA